MRAVIEKERIFFCIVCIIAKVNDCQSFEYMNLHSMAFY